MNLRTLLTAEKQDTFFDFIFRLEILRLEGSHKLNGGDGGPGGTMIEGCSGGFDVQDTVDDGGAGECSSGV